MSGQLFIVAAPSGAGKTTLVRQLLAQEQDIRLSISYTTRAPRAGEENGREYHFVSEAQFQAMIAADDFLEWAQVHGNYYGTSKRWISMERAAGRDVLLEIDWQGARQVRQVFPDAIGVFILPPSMEELTRRLTGRGTDSAEVIARRLAAAREEMSHVGEFGYVIINDDLQTALSDFIVVVRATRLQLETQRLRHPELFARLT
ncbi:guanylate kinase [Azovibrio restrictus]|uniref:guanylate kinase n=1 Tax=Azovibrio restrictus TaxID=146938 RepID=UPI0026EEAAEA|nr:guanylate kinase [Azovibrio restrictus]MDD3482477.1 guanylate kinase [Azovibrio restrictus]